jgi:hypothetical protein
MAYSGKGSQCAYVQGQTLSSSSTTATGLIIYNPPTSLYNLVFNTVALQVSVASSSMTGIALAYGAQTTTPTSTTAATYAGSTILGGAANNGIAYKAATLANAPANVFPLLHNDASIGTTGVDSIIVNLLNSANDSPIVLPPGNVLTLNALGGASAANALTAYISWIEVNVNNYPVLKVV